MSQQQQVSSATLDAGVDAKAKVQDQKSTTQPTVATQTGLTPHPFADSAYFEKNPPIPIFNFVINNQTGAIEEDRTGQA